MSSSLFVCLSPRRARYYGTSSLFYPRRLIYTRVFVCELSASREIGGERRTAAGQQHAEQSQSEEVQLQHRGARFGFVGVG
jgi:hypothetical protein